MSVSDFVKCQGTGKRTPSPPISGFDVRALPSWSTFRQLDSNVTKAVASTNTILLDAVVDHATVFVPALGPSVAIVSMSVRVDVGGIVEVEVDMTGEQA